MDVIATHCAALPLPPLATPPPPPPPYNRAY
jgi:hypothetical protein